MFSFLKAWPLIEQRLGVSAVPKASEWNGPTWRFLLLQMLFVFSVHKVNKHVLNIKLKQPLQIRNLFIFSFIKEWRKKKNLLSFQEVDALHKSLVILHSKFKHSTVIYTENLHISEQMTIRAKYMCHRLAEEIILKSSSRVINPKYSG